MSGALRRNWDEALDAADEAIDSVRRASKGRRDQESAELRKYGDEMRGKDDELGPDSNGSPDVNGPRRPDPAGNSDDGTPEWLEDLLRREDLPYWRRRIAEGQQFNYQNHRNYDYNEVRTADGKYLDSYSPPDEIVSRKHTQLADVKPETAMRYLDEIENKYWPGTRTDPNGDFHGDPLAPEATPYLEVPVQDGPIPQSVIDYANGFVPPIIIRDPTGREYN